MAGDHSRRRPATRGGDSGRTADPPSAGRTSHAVAGLDRRFSAFVLDRLLGASIAAAGCLAAYRLLPERGWTAGVVAAIGLLLLVGLALAVAAGLRGTSPGKAVLGLRVVRPGTEEPVGVPAAMLRAVVLAVAGVPTFGLGVAALALTALGDRTGQRRGWHDHLAASVVVDVRAVPAEADQPAQVPATLVNLTALRLVPRPVQPPVAEGPVEAPALPPELPADPAAPGAPARWWVDFDTGESLVVQRLTVVGRGPRARPDEPVGQLLALRSGDRSLSPTHAQLQAVPDGALVVMDRGSTSGTFLVRGGAVRRLPAGRPATLLDGDLVRLGDRTMTVRRQP